MKQNAELSLVSVDQSERLKALKNSRLVALVKDQVMIERISEAALNLLTDDKLRECNEASIWGALYKAVSMGFRLERDFGECYLIPRSLKVTDKEGRESWVKTCVFQIGYKGWKAIALQSGNLKFLQAHPVYKEDVFLYEYGSEAKIKHIPADETGGVSTHFYAYGRLPGGGEIFEVITKQDSEKSRRHSESQYDTLGSGKNKVKQFSEKPRDIWGKHYAAMALRVPIKRLCMALPMTKQIEAAEMADGSVTYLQKDGTVTTILPADVEAGAKDPEAEAADPTIIPNDLAERFLSFKDDLDGVDSFDRLCDFFKGFAKDGPVELAGRLPFVKVVYERAAVLATDVDQLTKFYHLGEHWKKTPELVKILTDKKTQIEKDAKAKN